MIIWIIVGILVFLGALYKWFPVSTFYRLSRAESPKRLVKGLALGGNGSSLIIGVSRDSWLIEVIKVGRDSPGSLILAIPILETTRPFVEQLKELFVRNGLYFEKSDLFLRVTDLDYSEQTFELLGQLVTLLVNPEKPWLYYHYEGPYPDFKLSTDDLTRQRKGHKSILDEL